MIKKDTDEIELEKLFSELGTTIEEMDIVLDYVMTELKLDLNKTFEYLKELSEKIKSGDNKSLGLLIGLLFSGLPLLIDSRMESSKKFKEDFVNELNKNKRNNELIEHLKKHDCETCNIKNTCNIREDIEKYKKEFNKITVH